MTTFGIVRAAVNTSTGTQDFRDANLDTTPTAAIFIITKAVTDGTAASDAMMAVGFTDGTNEVSNCFSSEDAQATSDTYRQASITKCIEFHDPSDGALDGEADFSAWLSDSGSGAGVQINWSNAPDAAYLMTVILFAATNAEAGVFNPQVVVDTATTVTPGFQANLIFFWQNGNTMPRTLTGSGKASFGAVDGSLNNRSWAVNIVDNKATSENNGRIAKTRSSMNNASSASLNFAQECTAIGATTFDVTTRDANGVGTHGIAYLALDMAETVWVGDADVTNSTGNQSNTGPGFEPQGIVVCSSAHESWDTGDTSGLGGVAHIGAFTANNAYSNAVHDEDAVTTTNSGSLSDDVCVNALDHTGAAMSVTTFVSLDATGWTWNVTTAPSAVKRGFAVAIETDVTASSPSEYLRRYEGTPAPNTNLRM